MAESIVKNENYIVIQGWMLSELKLKGNELIIYAIIYGFSQSEGQSFTGSLRYLADWTNSTKRGVMKCLKSLTEKGYITKKENIINGVKFCEYRVTKFTGVWNKVHRGIEQSSLPPMEQSSPNNIDINNIEDKKDNNILSSAYSEIISYLNQKTGKRYKSTIPKTQTLIKARMKEDFTIDDFKTVIDNKCAEWLGDSKMEKFLRPETLFGTKFESYLNSNSRVTNNQSVVNTGYRPDADLTDLDDLF